MHAVIQASDAQRRPLGIGREAGRDIELELERVDVVLGRVDADGRSAGSCEGSVVGRSGRSSGGRMTTASSSSYQ